MTYLEIHNALLSITQAKSKECKERLVAISNENPTEKKAVHLEYGMYNFCTDIFTTRKDILQIRQRYFQRIMHKYPKLSAVYQALDDEGKLCFIAAIHGELFIRDQWIEKKTAELTAAEASGDTKNVFEITIMLGAVKSMFAAWEAWRMENNIFPCIFEGDCQ